VEEAEAYGCEGGEISCTFAARADDEGSGGERPMSWLISADETMTPLKERILVRRLKDHDERAFSEFVRVYQNQIFNLVFRMLSNREEAEDVAQEVFITVFKNIGSFRGDCRLSTWIYRIATNHCRNRIKYLGRRRAQEHREYLDEMAKLQPKDGMASQPTAGQVARPDQMAEGKQMEKLVQNAIAALDDEHREVIVLRDIKNLTYQEICEITGLPEGTVKSRLHRARIALKEKLKDVL
jgi:RNA polymerase sigma-70 factor (ECF subfamily)